ncbi:MAG TPA: glutamate-1-semialdehyde 2,1-aminomutase [Syntrophomonadaceae bacterium]|nr:glutamate-1-semialdehyde 2,1-aminomutase [Syntrophomonadaceae bacterium]
MLRNQRSTQLFQTAQTYIPGGVNSPVRAFKAVGMDPLFIKEAHGSRVIDVDENEYIDYVGSWGPLILGHSHPRIVEAIQEAAVLGTSYGAPCAGEVELACTICQAIPSMEKVRMVSSGTEATMSAVRLARAFTGRSRIIKFIGCYHGHGDSFLIKAGSGLLTSGVPSSPGVPAALADLTLVADYNDLSTVDKLFDLFGQDIAAVIVEPVVGNMGLVLPDQGFLSGLRDITRQYGSLLIFDEVITGFRLTFGGFQNIIGIQPDLTTLGKIIGGGLPVGAYGGRRDIMDRISPQGDVYQAGTLSGNPLAMAAGLTTLKILKEEACYAKLEELGQVLVSRMREVFEAHAYSATINQLGSMFSIFFTKRPVAKYEDVMTCDTEAYAKFFRALLQEGIYLPPAQFEVAFVSCAHGLQDLAQTIEGVDRALDRLVKES